MPTRTPTRRPAAKAPGASRYLPDDVDDDDDDEETAPRAKRRSARTETPSPRRRPAAVVEDDDEDEDEVPARRRTTAKPAPARRAKAEPDEDDDEDEDDEPAPRSRRTKDAPARRSKFADDEDDEDEPDEDDDEEPSAARRRAKAAPPARRRSAREEPDEDEDDEDDEEDERPRGRGKKSSSAGFGAYNKKRQKMGTFNSDLKVPDDRQILVKFMDDEPFSSFGQHWITTAKGLRSHVCLETKCPLCDKLGDSPRPVGAFNVLLLDEDADPAHFVWACGPGIIQILEKKAAARTGPLSKEYYAVSKSKPKGGKGATTYIIDLVRSRDLEEEWGIAPLTDKELAKYEAKLSTEEKYVRTTPRAELLAISRDAMDEDD